MLIIEKNRNGRTGTVYLSHNDSMTRFAEYEPPKEWIMEQLSSSSASDKKDWRKTDRAYLEFKKQKKNDGGKLFD